MRHLLRWMLLAAAVVASVPAGAQARALGAPHRLVTVDADEPVGPMLVSRPGHGGYLLATNTPSSSGPDALRVQLLDAEGRPVARAHTIAYPIPAGHTGEGGATFAYDSRRDEFLVFLNVWDSTTMKWSDLLTQRIDARGRQIGPRHRISSAHAYLADGARAEYDRRSDTFIAVWTSESIAPGGDLTEAIHARRLTHSGVPSGPEIALTPPYDFRVPFGGWSWAREAHGRGMLVTWTTGAGMFARRLSFSGRAGSTVLVTRPHVPTTAVPAVVPARGGGFMLAWADDRPEGHVVAAALTRPDGRLRTRPATLARPSSSDEPVVDALIRSTRSGRSLLIIDYVTDRGHEGVFDRYTAMLLNTPDQILRAPVDVLGNTGPPTGYVDTAAYDSRSDTALFAWVAPPPNPGDTTNTVFGRRLFLK